MNQLSQVQEKLQSRVLSIEESKSLKGKGCGRRSRRCGGRRRRNGGCSSGGGSTVTETTTDVTLNIEDGGTDSPIFGVGFDLA